MSVCCWMCVWWMLGVDGTQSWAREFLKAFDLVVLDPPNVTRYQAMLMAMADAWPLYFGASWPVKVCARAKATGPRVRALGS